MQRDEQEICQLVSLMVEDAVFLRTGQPPMIGTAYSRVSKSGA